MQLASVRLARSTEELVIVKSFSDGLNQWKLKNDFQRGLAFVLLSSAILCLLIVAERPHWAEPWLIASFFTFAVWRLNRQTSK